MKRLRKAGWTPIRTTGSHTLFKCGCGGHTMTVPDGHRMISPGVHNKVAKAMQACEEAK